MPRRQEASGRQQRQSSIQLASHQASTQQPGHLPWLPADEAASRENSDRATVQPVNDTRMAEESSRYELSEAELKSLRPNGSNYQWGQTSQLVDQPVQAEGGPEQNHPSVSQSTVQPAPGRQSSNSWSQQPQVAHEARYRGQVNPQTASTQQWQPPAHQMWQQGDVVLEGELPESFDEAFESMPWDSMSDQAYWGMNDPTMNNREIIRIPIRLKPGERPNIRPEDILLRDGDVVFIETRETEIFYTGGLLGGGQYTLPRDYDLDVLGAIAIAQGASRQQSLRQIGGVSALNGDVTISASQVVILRKLEDGSQVPIEVDLYKAIKDPHQRVLIKPGDIVMLRYTPLEAFGAFVERNLLESALLGVAAGSFNGGGN